jgi:hypothetical protein
MERVAAFKQEGVDMDAVENTLIEEAWAFDADKHSSLPMEILLPQQTTVDDIVFWTTELICPERTKITRLQTDITLGQRQAGDIVCGSCGWCGLRTGH